MVKKVYETKPEKQYIFAIDNNKNPTQRKLISAISNGIGTGLIESVDGVSKDRKILNKKTPLAFDEWKVPLSLNLWVKPSNLFVKQNEDEENDFKWHCEVGLPKQIQSIKEEYCKSRGLKPIKIVIAGPPGSGKSSFGAQLASHYNVPHIHAKKLLEEIESWDREKEHIWNIKQQKKAKEEEEKERLRLLQEQIEQEEKAKLLAEKKLRGEEDEGDKEDSRIQSRLESAREGKEDEGAGEKKEGEEDKKEEGEGEEEDEEARKKKE